MQITSPLIINEEPKLSNFEHIEDHFERKLTFTIYMRIYIRCRLSEIQLHRCCFCQCVTTELRNRKNSSTVEHIIPRSEGGSDDIENFLMSCSKCNTNRGIRPVDEFLKLITNPDIVIHPHYIVPLEEEIKYNTVVKEFKEFGMMNPKQVKRLRPKKFRRNLDKLEVLKAFRISSQNPFEEDTRKWRQFNRLSKIEYFKEKVAV